MTPDFTKVHNRFKFNGLHFNHEELKEVAYSLIKEGLPYEKIIGDFLTDWLNTNGYVFVNTSGSTGQPKRIKLSKQAMVNSAIATGDFFNLKPGDKALLCLPSEYIAGKMMLVRALILGLELDYIQPNSSLDLDTSKHYQFSAMVPLQVSNSINNLSNIDTLIIGGSPVSSELRKKITDIDTKCYETYGMTETITHVAVKTLASKAQNEQSYFNALPHISFYKDDRDCLVISAPRLGSAPFITNDIVELVSETTFKWLGRYDTIINSGGVKLIPEQIEAKLKPLIKDRFIVSAIPHKELGEQLILIVENTDIDADALYTKIKRLQSLTKFEVPKEIFTLKQLVETQNGKIQRQKTTELVIS